MAGRPTTRRARFLANLMDSDSGSDEEDNQLLISFRRPQRPGSASAACGQSVSSGRSSAESRPRRGTSSNRHNLKRAAGAQERGSPPASLSSVAGSTSTSSRPKRSRFNHHHASPHSSTHSISHRRNSGEVEEGGRVASIRLSDLLAEFDGRGGNEDQMGVSSSGYDSHMEGGSSGGSPGAGSGSSEVQQGLAALDLIDVDDSDGAPVERALAPHPYQTRQASATNAERRAVTPPASQLPLLDRLLILDRSLQALDAERGSPRGNNSSPDLNTARNFELDDIDGVPLQGGTEPRRGGLRRSGSLPAADRNRRSSSSAGFSRRESGSGRSGEGVDVHVFLDRIDGVPLSGRTEPRSGGSLSRGPSAASGEIIDLDADRPGPSTLPDGDDDEIQVVAQRVNVSSVSPGTMALIHQLEVDEAMARRLQQQEDTMDHSSSSSPPPVILTPRPRVRRRPPTRRGGTDGSGSGNDGSDVRVILPRLEQLADIVHTMMEDDRAEDGGGTAGDVDEPGPPTRAPTHFTRSNRVRRGRQRRQTGTRTAETSLTSFLDRMASSTFENSRLDYEALMDLVERIGDAGPAGLSRREIGRLPTVKYTGLEDNNDLTSCTICMSDFSANERLRLLPCTHTFHTGCIDRWLERSNCPICRNGVRDHVVAGHS